MNVHRCPNCNHGFWARGNLGDNEKLPRHTTNGKLATRATSLLVCDGSRQPATVVKPPNPEPVQEIRL